MCLVLARRLVQREGINIQQAFLVLTLRLAHTEHLHNFFFKAEFRDIGVFCSSFWKLRRRRYMAFVRSTLQTWVCVFAEIIPVQAHEEDPWASFYVFLCFSALFSRSHRNTECQLFFSQNLEMWKPTFHVLLLWKIWKKIENELEAARSDLCVKSTRVERMK